MGKTSEAERYKTYMINYGYVNNGMYGLDDLPPELHPVCEDSTDRLDFERFFFQLPKEQTEIMISMFLGLKPKEIVKIHRFRNIGRFYSMSAKLRDSYKSKKERFLGYN